jgi:DNA-binding NarL/FixJ family response regulator
MVTAGMSDAVTLQAMEAGASGVFLKHSSLDQQVTAIHQVVKGEIWLDTTAAHSLFKSRSARERSASNERSLSRLAKAKY